MPIIIDKKETGRTPAIAIKGYLDFNAEDQLRNLGAVFRSNRRRKFLPEESKEYQIKNHYEIPAPLVKRLFEANGNTVPPTFMANWENFVEPKDWDADSQEDMELMLKLKDFRINRTALEFYKSYEIFEDKLHKIKDGDEHTINHILLSYGIKNGWFAREPKPHQKAGLAFFLLCLSFGWGHILLFDEMRTGKTKQAIDIGKFLLEQRLIDSVLVLVPNTIKRVWRNEIMLDCPVHGCFTSIIEGTKTQKQNIWRTNQFWYIVNYEGARADKEELYKWEYNRKYLLIADEAHKLKNPDSQQSQAVLGLNPTYSVLMTGTPVANRPEDAWAMTNFVCSGLLGKDMEDFYYKFAQRGGYSGKDVLGYRNLDEVKYRLSRVSMRRLRKDIMFDQVMRQTRSGVMTGKQKEKYEQMRDELMAELMNDDGEFTAVKARNKLVQILRLQQITSGYLSSVAGDQVWFDENWKLKELDEFIEEYLDDIGKLVIWSRFVPPIHMLTRRYEKYGSTSIYGEIKDTHNNPARTNRMYEFQDNPKCRIMVAQIQSASLGLGFNPATFEVFYDKWWSPAANKQAEDRIVGIKNPVPVTVISLITEDAIDERIEYLLNRKWDWARSITGDVDDEVYLPKMDKNTLFYLLAKPEEVDKYKKGLD